MKIAYDLRYATDHFPGVGTHAFHLLRELLALPGGDEYVVLWNPSAANSRFELGGIRTHERVRWLETPAPALAFATPWRTGALLRTTGPDVLFSPFYLAPWRSGSPTVLTLHDVLPLDPHGPFGPRGRWLFRAAMWGAARSEGVLTSSEASRREILARTSIPASRVHVVRPGVVPVRPSSGACRPARLPDGPFALVVGINKPHKNLETLARAWAGFRDHPPLRLVGAGPVDPRFPGLEDLARRQGAAAVTELGRVSEDELTWLYLNATIVLFPTRAEGFGFPLLEAFAIGAPALVSDLPALREIGEGAARFVDPLDAAAWCEAVKELSADPEKRAAMSAAGRARAGEFTYERTARESLAILHGVVDPRERTS